MFVVVLCSILTECHNIYDVLKVTQSIARMAIGKKIASSVVYLICLVGCLAQLYQITQLYLLYETVTLLKISRPEMVTPPQVYVCFERGIIINRFNEKAKEYNNTYPIKMIFDNSPNLSYSNIVSYV